MAQNMQFFVKAQQYLDWHKKIISFILSFLLTHKIILYKYNNIVTIQLFQECWF